MEWIVVAPVGLGAISPMGTSTALLIASRPRERRSRHVPAGGLVRPPPCCNADRERAANQLATTSHRGSFVGRGAACPRTVRAWKSET